MEDGPEEGEASPAGLGGQYFLLTGHLVGGEDAAAAAWKWEQCQCNKAPYIRRQQKSPHGPRT